MKTFRWLLMLPIVGLLFCLFAIRYDQTTEAEAAEPAAADLPRLDDACHPGKRTLVVFGADWCGYCKVLDEKTLKDPAVKARLKDYVIVHVDVEKNRGLARVAGVSALPTSFALSASCETKGKLEGFYPPDDFLKWLTETEQ